MIADLIKESEKKMGYSLDHLMDNLGKVRTGRASLVIVEGVKVDYYGTPTPLSQVATLGTPDSQTITIQPWDVSIIKDIEKAIQVADIGITPSNDGKLVRLSVPPLTQETRQQMVKLLKKYTEECKVAIRNVRRDCNDKIKALEKKHEVSEDESHKGSDELQKITDKYIADADKIAHAREKDIMDV